MFLCLGPPAYTYLDPHASMNYFRAITVRAAMDGNSALLSTPSDTRQKVYCDELTRASTSVSGALEWKHWNLLHG